MRQNHLFLCCYVEATPQTITDWDSGPICSVLEYTVCKRFIIVGGTQSVFFVVVACNQIQIRMKRDKRAARSLLPLLNNLKVGHPGIIVCSSPKHSFESRKKRKWSPAVTQKKYIFNSSSSAQPTEPTMFGPTPSVLVMLILHLWFTDHKFLREWKKLEFALHFFFFLQKFWNFLLWWWNQTRRK